MQYFYVLLLFTDFLSESYSSLLPFSKHPPLPAAKQNLGNLQISGKSNQKNTGCRCRSCECSVCNITLAAPKKVINLYRREIENVVPPKPFGSFCVKCAACVAVATEMQEVINSIGEECELDKTKQKLLQQELNKKIKYLCQKGFKNYDLQLLGKYNNIPNYFKCVNQLEGNVNGNWTKKLRELCALYLSRIDLEKLSNSVWNTGEELTKKLCRGSGIFRDCSNLKCNEKHIADEQNDKDRKRKA